MLFFLSFCFVYLLYGHAIEMANDVLFTNGRFRGAIDCRIEFAHWWENLKEMKPELFLRERERERRKKRRVYIGGGACAFVQGEGEGGKYAYFELLDAYGINPCQGLSGKLIVTQPGELVLCKYNILNMHRINPMFHV